LPLIFFSKFILYLQAPDHFGGQPEPLHGLAGVRDGDNATRDGRQLGGPCAVKVTPPESANDRLEDVVARQSVQESAAAKRRIFFVRCVAPASTPRVKVIKEGTKKGKFINKTHFFNCEFK
jgi:hypothetical protein